MASALQSTEERLSVSNASNIVFPDNCESLSSCGGKPVAGGTKFSVDDNIVCDNRLPVNFCTVYKDFVITTEGPCVAVYRKHSRAPRKRNFTRFCQVSSCNNAYLELMVRRNIFGGQCLYGLCEVPTVDRNPADRLPADENHRQERIEYVAFGGRFRTSIIICIISVDLHGTWSPSVTIECCGSSGVESLGDWIWDLKRFGIYEVALLGRNRLFTYLAAAPSVTEVNQSVDGDSDNVVRTGVHANFGFDSFACERSQAMSASVSQDSGISAKTVLKSSEFLSAGADSSASNEPVSAECRAWFDKRQARFVDCTISCILYSGQLIGQHCNRVTVAAGTVFNEVLLWNGTTGEVLHTLRGHSGVIFSVTINIAQSLIVTTSDDRSARVYRICDKKVNSRTLKQKKREVCTSVADCGDGQRSLSSALYDEPPGSHVSDADSNRSVDSDTSSFSALLTCGSRCAVADYCKHGTAKIEDSAGVGLAAYHVCQLPDATFSTCGNSEVLAASASKGFGNVRVGNTFSVSQSCGSAANYEADEVASPDWWLKKNVVFESVLYGHESRVWRASATASNVIYTAGEDGFVCKWRLPNGTLCCRRKAPFGGSISSLLVFADAEQLLIGGACGSLSLVPSQAFLQPKEDCVSATSAVFAARSRNPTRNAKSGVGSCGTPSRREDQTFGKSNCDFSVLGATRTCGDLDGRDDNESSTGFAIFEPRWSFPSGLLKADGGVKCVNLDGHQLVVTTTSGRHFLATFEALPVQAVEATEVNGSRYLADYKDPDWHDSNSVGVLRSRMFSADSFGTLSSFALVSPPFSHTLRTFADFSAPSAVSTDTAPESFSSQFGDSDFSASSCVSVSPSASVSSTNVDVWPGQSSSTAATTFSTKKDFYYRFYLWDRQTFGSGGYVRSLLCYDNPVTGEVNVLSTRQGGSMTVFRFSESQKTLYQLKSFTLVDQTYMRSIADVSESSVYRGEAVDNVLDSPDESGNANNERSHRDRRRSLSGENSNNRNEENSDDSDGNGSSRQHNATDRNPPEIDVNDRLRDRQLILSFSLFVRHLWNDIFDGEDLRADRSRMPFFGVSQQGARFVRNRHNTSQDSPSLRNDNPVEGSFSVSGGENSRGRDSNSSPNANVFIDRSAVRSTNAQNWATCVLQPTSRYLVIGNRTGDVLLYSLEATRSYPLSFLQGLHGSKGTTDIKLVPAVAGDWWYNHRRCRWNSSGDGGSSSYNNDDEEAQEKTTVRLLSAGRDGRIYELEIRDDRLSCLRIFWQHTTIEWIGRLFILSDRRLVAACYRGENFLLYDVDDEFTIAAIPSGGGHRRWDCSVVAGDALNGIGARFLYARTFGRQVLVDQIELDERLPSVVKRPLHTRKVNCAHTLWESARRAIVITGGEDNLVVISEIILSSALQRLDVGRATAHALDAPTSEKSPHIKQDWDAYAGRACSRENEVDSGQLLYSNYDSDSLCNQHGFFDNVNKDSCSTRSINPGTDKVDNAETGTFCRWASAGSVHPRVRLFEHISSVKCVASCDMSYLADRTRAKSCGTAGASCGSSSVSGGHTISDKLVVSAGGQGQLIVWRVSPNLRVELLDQYLVRSASATKHLSRRQRLTQFHHNQKRWRRHGVTGTTTEEVNLRYMSVSVRLSDEAKKASPTAEHSAFMIVAAGSDALVYVFCYTSERGISLLTGVTGSEFCQLQSVWLTDSSVVSGKEMTSEQRLATGAKSLKLLRKGSDAVQIDALDSLKRVVGRHFVVADTSGLIRVFQPGHLLRSMETVSITKATLPLLKQDYKSTSSPVPTNETSAGLHSVPDSDELLFSPFISPAVHVSSVQPASTSRNISFHNGQSGFSQGLYRECESGSSSASNTTGLPLSPMSYIISARLRAHQSGINALALRWRHFNGMQEAFIASGGDDNSIVLSKLVFPTTSQGSATRQILDDYTSLSTHCGSRLCRFGSFANAHGAQVTAIQFLDGSDHFVSVSIDQRITLWRYLTSADHVTADPLGFASEASPQFSLHHQSKSSSDAVSPVSLNFLNTACMINRPPSDCLSNCQRAFRESDDRHRCTTISYSPIKLAKTAENIGRANFHDGGEDRSGRRTNLTSDVSDQSCDQASCLQPLSSWMTAVSDASSCIVLQQSKKLLVFGQGFEMIEIPALL